MEEHIIAYDKPPQYGRGIPAFYEIQIFNVPNVEKQKMIHRLKSLGFTGIREEIFNKGRIFGNNTIGLNGQPCIRAKYFTDGKISEYKFFWEKKEKIELEIDNLNITNKMENTQ